MVGMGPGGILLRIRSAITWVLNSKQRIFSCYCCLLGVKQVTIMEMVGETKRRNCFPEKKMVPCFAPDGRKCRNECTAFPCSMRAPSQHLSLGPRLLRVYDNFIILETALKQGLGQNSLNLKYRWVLLMQTYLMNVEWMINEFVNINRFNGY